MDDGLKQRLIGAIVLLALAVIFLPVFFDRDPAEPVDQTTQIPTRPDIITINIAEPIPPKQVDLAPVPQEMYIPDQEASVGIEPEPPGLTESGTPKSWVLQVSSFKGKDLANNFRDKLLEADYPAYNREVGTGDSSMTRVYVGPKLDKSALIKVKGEIDSKFGVESILLEFKPK